MITIIGWYGTETMGDISILDGIFQILNKSLNVKSEIKIGSLYPFHTQRTMLENEELFSQYKKLEISIFDIKDNESTKDIIRNTSLLIFGGGPLMDCIDLNLMKKVSRYATRQGIPFVILGCGIGPLRKKAFEGMVGEILDVADLIVLRDELSAKTCLEKYKHVGKVHIITDPAVISVEKYLNDKAEKRTSDYIAINFREYPYLEYGNTGGFDESTGERIVKNVLKNHPVRMVPMHTFSIGNDDRLFLGSISEKINCKELEVLFRPMNLYQLYDVYQNAYGCIGMRYHAVLMQTLLNGNNIIIDYTDPESGKIPGFLKTLDVKENYKKRYINLHEKGYEKRIDETINLLDMPEEVQNQATDVIDKYVTLISQLL